MRSVAFLSLENPEGFYIYDPLAEPALAKRGYTLKTLPWTADADWSSFDAVVIRSTWDYTTQAARFLEKLGHIATQTRLLNELEVVRWNLNKSYLLELESHGAVPIPTRLGHAPGRSDLMDAFEAFGSEALLIKPRVGANSDGAHIVGRHDAPPIAGDVLIQPFLPSIRTQGEHSLFFFGGHFSHAIVKRPKGGDFRVQEEHGGRLSRVEPTPACLNAARRVLEALKRCLGREEPLLYARVDLVDGPEWKLMELELIEPSLYFQLDDQAPVRFAEALVARLES